MTRRVLMVVTSHDQMGNTGKPTGWYLPEIAHPYHVFKKAGFDCDFVSPKGGKAPMDPSSAEAFKDDDICNEFLKNQEVMDLLNKTKKPNQVSSASDYDAVFYVGGHGPMFDLPENTDIGDIAAKVYENGGVLGAVCHGTAGLIPVKLPNGESVVKGQKVTSFTNEEEDLINLSDAMPFMLETKLGHLGANFSAGKPWQCNVCVSGRIVTGQNPASANAMAEAIVSLLQ